MSRVRVSVTLPAGQVLEGWVHKPYDPQAVHLYSSETGDDYVYIESQPDAKIKEVYYLPYHPWAIVRPERNMQDVPFVPFILGRDGLWYEAGDGEGNTAESLLNLYGEAPYRLVTLYAGDTSEGPVFS